MKTEEKREKTRSRIFFVYKEKLMYNYYQIARYRI